MEILAPDFAFSCGSDSAVYTLSFNHGTSLATQTGWVAYDAASGLVLISVSMAEVALADTTSKKIPLVLTAAIEPANGVTSSNSEVQWAFLLQIPCSSAFSL